MNLELTDEQVMLREAAVSALARTDTVAAARAALDGGPLPDLWPTACAAGWPGLLVPESFGGAGLGAYDAMLVLEECGRRLAGAGLLGHLPATLLLTRAAEAGDERAAALLPALADGSQRAALLHAQPTQERRLVHAPERRVLAYARRGRRGCSRRRRCAARPGRGGDRGGAGV